MTSIQLRTQPNFQPAPADTSKLGGVPVPAPVRMFGVDAGRIYRFGATNDQANRDWLEGGLEFYGIKSISRWSTPSEKYGELTYVRLHLVSPFQGVTYCLQLSDGGGRNNQCDGPPSHIRSLTSALLKAKREVELRGLSIGMMPGAICPKAGNDANVTFLNLFVGSDPFDTNSLTQIFCEENERLGFDFADLDAAVDELAEHLGQPLPEDAAADAAAEAVADAIDVDAINDVAPF